MEAAEVEIDRSVKEVEAKVQMVEALTDKLNDAKAKAQAKEAALELAHATAATDQKQSMQVRLRFP